MIRSFFSAVGFLTIIPVSKQEINQYTTLWFPVVGLFLGGILFLLNFVLTPLLHNPIVIVTVLLVIYIFLTGGLHIDGLSDSVDGVVGGRSDRRKILSIMDDSHIGAEGVIAVVCDILLKFVLLMSLLSNVLLIFPVISRWAMVLSMVLSRPAKDSGAGRLFIENTKLQNFFIATLFCVIFAVIILPLIKTFIAILISGLVTVLTTFFFTKKIGGMSGDSIGAINEITEIVVLLVFVIR